MPSHFVTRAKIAFLALLSSPWHRLVLSADVFHDGVEFRLALEPDPGLIR